MDHQPELTNLIITGRQLVSPDKTLVNQKLKSIFTVSTFKNYNPR